MNLTPDEKRLEASRPWRRLSAAQARMMRSAHDSRRKWAYRRANRYAGDFMRLLKEVDDWVDSQLPPPVF